MYKRQTIFDTTIGWRFVNPEMETLYNTHSMPQTADNMAADFAIARADQDAFALRSQQRWAAADAAGRFADELVPVVIAQKKTTQSGLTATNTRAPRQRCRCWPASRESTARN